MHWAKKKHTKNTHTQKNNNIGCQKRPAKVYSNQGKKFGISRPSDTKCTIVLHSNSLCHLYVWAYMFVLHCWSDVLTSAFSIQILNLVKTYMYDRGQAKDKIPPKMTVVFILLLHSYPIPQFKEFSRRNSRSFQDFLWNSSTFQARTMCGLSYLLSLISSKV